MTRAVEVIGAMIRDVEQMGVMIRAVVRAVVTWVILKQKRE